MAWSGIVKVQRSLSTNEDGERCLIYDKGREHVFSEGPMLPEVRAMFLGDEPKFYAHASLKRGHLHISARVDPQSW